MASPKKSILVTGGNSGIGLALCKLLATEHGCHVFLGSRDEARGAKALATIAEAHPGAAVEVVQIDVASDASVQAAAAAVAKSGKKLYAVVNNAGIGLAQPNAEAKDTAAIVNTNFRGPRRVVDAFADLVTHRIVNVSSGVASMWLRDQDAATKALFSDPALTMAALDAAVAKEVAAGNVGMGNGYGVSKAALTALTLVQARAHPSLTVTSLSPGFIVTPMTQGYGAKLSPEEGCVSSLKCLFGDVASGHYYGSDGLRSPLTCTRDPGTPEYGGEADPDPAKYNK
jgi:NAD(P)-dependent dehydrogenase (short-subunit alcohol dehydrogenase family)